MTASPALVCNLKLISPGGISHHVPTYRTSTVKYFLQDLEKQKRTMWYSTVNKYKIKGKLENEVPAALNI